MKRLGARLGARLGGRLRHSAGRLADAGRIEFTSANDTEALDAFHRLSELEGIIPALESSHAVAWVLREARGLAKDELVLVNLSGRGDKDVRQVAAIEGVSL